MSLFSAGATGGNGEFPKITEAEFLEANDISKYIILSLRKVKSD